MVEVYREALILINKVAYVMAELAEEASEFQLGQKFTKEPNLVLRFSCSPTISSLVLEMHRAWFTCTRLILGMESNLTLREGKLFNKLKVN